MSRVVKQDSHWRHHDGLGNVTIVEKDPYGRYFVPGFYGDSEPRFLTLSDVQDFIDGVQSADALPEDWRVLRYL